MFSSSRRKCKRFKRKSHQNKSKSRENKDCTVQMTSSHEETKLRPFFFMIFFYNSHNLETCSPVEKQQSGIQFFRRFVFRINGSAKRSSEEKMEFFLQWKIEAKFNCSIVCRRIKIKSDAKVSQIKSIEKNLFKSSVRRQHSPKDRIVFASWTREMKMFHRA